MAKCLNGGACVNGQCVCAKNFDGEFCENDLTKESNWGIIVLVILILAAGGIGAYFLWQKNKDTWMKSSDENNQHLNNEFIEKDPKPIQID